MIQTSNWYLRFEGSEADAASFVQDMRELQSTTGLDYPKVFNDFLFAIEVALENANAEHVHG
jgi:hypothetical protein